MYTHILWDFNGTILNDVEAGWESINVLLARRGLPVLHDLCAYRRVFDFPVIDYYRRVGLPTEEGFDALAVEWVAEYQKRMAEPALYDGVVNLLTFFEKAGYCQQILSACEKNLLASQLRALGINHYFTQFWGSDDIYGGGKIGAARQWRAAHPKEEALLLGDTVHDGEVAKAIGADCILIADGHQDAERLAALGVPVFPNMRSLCEHFVKFSKSFG